MEVLLEKSAINRVFFSTPCLSTRGYTPFSDRTVQEKRKTQVDTKQPPGPDAAGPCAAGSCQQDNMAEHGENFMANWIFYGYGLGVFF